MNRQRNSKYLTSVRSLPPGIMADIRRKYERMSSPSKEGYNAVKTSPPKRPPPPRPRTGSVPLEICMESKMRDQSETGPSQTPKKLLQNKFQGRYGQEEETLRVELRGTGDPTNVSLKADDVFNVSDVSPDVMSGLSSVSVAQKTKMFESGIPKRDPSPSLSISTPSKKPLPPARQRSKCDSSSSDKDTKDEIDNLEASFIHDPSHKPIPPMKPPRTHAHDEYVKAKMVCREQSESATGTELTSSPVYTKIQKKQTTLTNDANQSNNSTPVNKRFLKPPKLKPRPFSVATDTFKDEDSDSDVKLRIKHNSYLTEHSDEEDENTSDDRLVPRHWDLPREMYPEPSSMRKSVSAECLHLEEDGADASIYEDLDPSSFDDMEKVHFDHDGYAVPNKYNRKNLGNSSSLETDGKQRHVSRTKNTPMRAKIKMFKNLFRPESDNSSKPARSKLEIVKQKINQAFGNLQDWGRARTSESKEEVVNDTSTDSKNGEDEDNDSRVDDAEIKKRKEHCGTVRLKTSASIRQSRKKQEVLYPQLFEYAVIVGLQLNTEKQEYEPYIIYKFPEIADSNISVPHFCFPDASNYKPTSSSSNKSQYFSFVLTNFDGGRVYGYCRRIMCSRSGGKFPEVICIISPVDAFQMYNCLLEHIEKRRAISLDHAQELIAASFGRPLPNPGFTLHIKSLDEKGDMEAIYIERPNDARMSNVNWECLLTNLGVDKLIKVFSCILLERSVLFAAKHLGVLSPTIHALASLLYPFSWQHTFIPVLPSQMIDVVCSPVPYIIGITSSQLQKALSLPIEELLVVDLDKKALLRTQGDEGTLIPKKMQKALKSALNMYKIDADVKSCQSLMIAEAFIRFFLEAVGHYGDYLTVQDGQPRFNKEEFISNTPSPALKQLLEWFTETQMFEVFISTQLEKKEGGSPIEYFLGKIAEFNKRGNKARRSRISSSGMT
ncbi:hypothetical protein ACJMK2_020094 [Sinanodonta woodiana]|uniref:UDENN domain-containing protein n=1 Tax=Sinanodonta woodiana TaxID=1069815 RepID=A0ABD3TZQ1_SINWO